MDKVTYIARLQWAALRRLVKEKGFKVKDLRRITGESQAQFYKYIHSDFEEAEVMPAHRWGLLCETLAQDFDNYTLLEVHIPVGMRLVKDDSPYTPNGINDEMRDLLVVGGRLGITAQHPSPEDLMRVSHELADLAKRIETEAKAIVRVTPSGDGTGIVQL